MKRSREKLVFGLDIGTRSVVGTVGYRSGERFIVLAQRVKEHETRAMLDGQIHDIKAVSATILMVKKELEKALGKKLKEVCIAAAGRVLRTITTQVELEFPKDKPVTQEDISELTMLGIEKSYEELAKDNEADIKFYCVCNSIIRYYLNRYPITNLEGHDAKSIGADVIATFLPDDVVDGLYKAVEGAGLEVVNLTLEPSAAIQVAIPEKFRMLNIALVDVGAGTSDISITKDGSIIAYGMIPNAGDNITELIAEHCLVDFATAEKIKLQLQERDTIEFEDIMGLPQLLKTEELLKVIEPEVEVMAKQVSDTIKELNGDKSVSAAFIVGGGGKIDGYVEALAKELGIITQRVALRGEEVMQTIDFMEEEIVKDSLLVTPVGICLSYYTESNNFIFVTFNGQKIKIYYNSHLTVTDAAMQAEFSHEALFPRRGNELNFTVNGNAKLVRGLPGEAAVIKINGKEVDFHAPIHANDKIEVVPSTVGSDGKMTLRQLPELKGSFTICVNEQSVTLPKFANVNGVVQTEYYDIQDGDVIEIQNYCTVEQITEFMDINMDELCYIYVNHEPADKDTLVYENFSVMWSTSDEVFNGNDEEITNETDQEKVQSEENAGGEAQEEADATVAPSPVKEVKAGIPVMVIVNGQMITLNGKSEYVFVDVFDYINFDLTRPQGKGIVTNLNGKPAQYMEVLKPGDVIDVYWRNV